MSSHRRRHKVNLKNISPSRSIVALENFIILLNHIFISSVAPPREWEGDGTKWRGGALSCRKSSNEVRRRSNPKCNVGLAGLTM